MQKENDNFRNILIPYIIFEIVFGVFCIFNEHSAFTFKNLLWPENPLWYLLALYIWRTILPGGIKLKHPIVIALLLNITTCLFTNMNGIMALQRVVGFLVFFLLGFYSSNERIERIKKIPVSLALFVLIAELLVFYFICYRYGEYTFLLNAMAHKVVCEMSIRSILMNLGVYLCLFGTAVFNGCLIMAIASKVKRLSDFGANTMPLYVCHIFVYMVCKKHIVVSNLLDLVVVNAIMITSISICSDLRFARIFNAVLKKITNCILVD